MADPHQPIHIWALFKHYYPNFSGAAIQGHRNLRYLASHGFTVTVLAARSHAAAAMPAELELDGLKIWYLPIIRQRNWGFVKKFAKFRILLMFVNALLGSLSLSLMSAWILLREGAPGDIVQLYSCSEFSFLVVWLAKKRHMHPVIRTTLLGSDEPSSQRGILGTLKRSAFFQAESVINISSALAKSCLDAGLDPKQVALIPNGVDTNVYCPIDPTDRESLCDRLGLDASKRFIVFVGAATYRKGIDVLINAFLTIHDVMRDVEVLVVGPCDFSDTSRFLPSRNEFVCELKLRLADAGCTARVHWLGEVENVHEYLQVADVFCLPTRREGLGTAIAEAMAVGLPIITSLLPDITTDLIPTDRDGILIDDHNTESYSKALLSVLQDSSIAKALGENARIRAKEEFELSTIAERYSQLYRNLHGQLV